MDSARKGRVLRVLDATHFYIQDSDTKNIVKLELNPPPELSGYHHLLRQFADSEIGYEVAKKTKMIEQFQKGKILMNGKDVTSLYLEPTPIEECTEQKVYEKDEILECYIMNVECLKIKLFIVTEKKTIVFYQSELRLPRMENIHPKEVFQKAQDYFKDSLQGEFVQIKINGSETYHEELNIHGEILRLHNGQDLKEQFIKDGYAEVSKNSSNYLSEHRIDLLNELVKQSKQEKKGIWGEGAKNKTSFQAMDHKYKEWDQWSKKNVTFRDIKNVENQIKQIGSELKKHSGSKPDPSKCRILLQAIISIFEDSINEKTLPLLENFCKIAINSLVNLQTGLSLQIDSMDFLKYLSKLLILVIFYVSEAEKESSKKMLMGVELDRIVKVVFRCCFIGNETFHEKVFDKRKQSDFERFSYDPTSLSGISSFSEHSDYEEAESLSKQVRRQKKLASAQTKIRVNSTFLLSLLFKNYSSIVQNHWEVCVKSNALTEDFLTFVQTLKITIDQEKMNKEEKRKLAALMRTNFGDHSLIMLVCFEQNSKVKVNAITCMINMIGNFPDRKIIDTTEPSQVQKQLKTTKSSFIPKSFIIFSGLRNALYFLLFSLHHEKNILIIVNIFKALTQLCQQSTLVDKMGFVEGMGLLMSNYVNPVLQFPWNIPELNELKALCISFLAALVSTQKKWQQMETNYLMSPPEQNVNYCLLLALESKQIAEEKIIIEIIKYFTRLCKRYYSSIFHEIETGKSPWNILAKCFIDKHNPHFGHFVEQILKSHFDQITLSKNYGFSQAQSRIISETISIAESNFAAFFESFLPVYAQVVSVENYISLINIITFVSYERWSEPEYGAAKDFLIFCFHSIHDSPKHKVYPSIQGLKTNSLMRIALIKLLGYLSFCRQFQRPEFSTQSIRSLINYSRAYKSLNCIVKITWGISNWANIDCFKTGLDEGELKQCLNYMVVNSGSDKEKIASNCTRGIGFILRHFTDNEHMGECISAIVKNLSHPILKVRTNSTKTLRTILQAKSQNENKKHIKIHEIMNLLEQNVLKNSYHLQTETLFLIKALGNPIVPEHMLKLYSHILHDLQSHTTMEYEFSEIKALRQLRRIILEEITSLPDQLLHNEQAINQLYESILDFILDSKEESARKEAENSKILERGFERGEEALNAVFNIRKEHFDEEKTIATEFILRGLRYKAGESDVELLRRVKKIAHVLSEKSAEWKQIGGMEIDGAFISIGGDV